MIKDTSLQDTLTLQSKPRLSSKSAWAAIVTFSSLVLFYFMSTWLSSSAVVNKKDIQVAKVIRGELLRDLATTGTIVAADAPLVYSTELGIVSFIVKPGQNVLKGELVARIDSPELLNQVIQQDSNLNSKKIELERQQLNARRALLKQKQESEQKKVKWQTAKREMARANIAIADSLISVQDFERVQDKLATAELAYQHAKQELSLIKDSFAFETKTMVYQLKFQQAVVDELNRRKQNLDLISPVNGVIGNWLVSQKARVEDNQALLSIVDLSRLEAELDIAESYVDELDLDMEVALKVAGKPLNGRLTSLSPEVKRGQVKARVSFLNPEHYSLRQNQRLSARIILEKKTDVLMIKRGQFVQSNAGKKSYVIKDGIAHKTPLNLGMSSLSHVEVLSGVQEGDELVVSSLLPFNNAAQVFLR